MNRIKEVLKEKGIKQTWLAKKLDKSYNMVNSYIQNRKQPSLSTLFRISEILDVNIRELIEQKLSRPTTSSNKTAREILHKHTADETAIDYLRDIIVECMEEYANQKIKGTPTAKEYYTEKNNGKPPDESTADGELITPLYAVRLMEEYASQKQPETEKPFKDCEHSATICYLPKAFAYNSDCVEPEKCIHHKEKEGTK